MSDFPFAPRVVGWELTLRCNMRCSHCGSRAGDPRPNELTVEEGFSLIDQMAELGTEVLTLSGGEPLTHPAWDKYAKRLVDHGVRTFMISNGLLLEQSVGRMLDCGLQRVGISLDGTEEVHDRIRNYPGSFRQALKGVKKAREAGIMVGVMSHISAVNRDSFPKMYEVFSEAGFEFWQIQVAFCQGRMEDDHNMLLDPADLPDFMKVVRGFQDRGGMRVVAGDNLGYFEEPCIRATPWRGCFAGRHVMGVDADGGIKGCLSFPHGLAEGNIREESLRTIWEDPQRFKFNRYFSPDMLTGHCHNCPHGVPCRAGCAVTAMSASGSRFDNPYCAYRVQSGKGAAGWAEAPAGSACPSAQAPAGSAVPSDVPSCSGGTIMDLEK